MTIYLGGIPISKLFLGSKEITKAYKGNELIFTNDPTPSSGGISLVDNGKKLKLATDYNFGDDTYPYRDIVVPNLYSSSAWSGEEETPSGTFAGWQFTPHIYHRADGEIGTISWVDLANTPIPFPISVGDYTWTSSSNNSDDIEGIKRLANNRTTNSVDQGTLGPAPYYPMSSLLNHQDFVGALKVEGLTANTDYALDVFLRTLDTSSVDNVVNTGVPIAIAVFDSLGNRLGLNCSPGEDKSATTEAGKYPDWMRQCGAIYDGATTNFNKTMSKLSVAFNPGEATTVYIAIMYKGSLWDGTTPGNCIWRDGTIGLCTNAYGANINQPLYLKASSDDDIMGQYVYIDTDTSQGDAQYTLTVDWNGVGHLTKITN